MPKKKTHDEIINEFKSIHGNRYNYSDVNYINSKTEVTIICSIHGKFNITPNHHKKGVGCNKCYFDSQKISKQEFVLRSEKYFGKIYDYSLFDDLPINGEKVQIKCTLHNLTFPQKTKNHMRGHTGCPKCKSAKLSGNRNKRGTIKSQIDLTKEFISRAIKVHGELYDYSKFIYTKTSTNGIIICPKHGSFPQSPSNHLKGTKCPDCSNEASKENSFKRICKDKEIDYAKALKRRQAGHSEEKIFADGYIRNERVINEITVFGEKYPNIEEAIRILKPPASSRTIIRWLKEGLTPEEAFEKIPNPGYAKGIIYLITNTKNDKKYIGLTIQTLKRRWKYHIEQANGNHIKSEESLHNAIRKYGKDIFHIQKVDIGTTKKDLENKERKWIKKMNTLIPNGYNISTGGVSGGSNKKPTVINGIHFESVKSATEYIAKTKNISLDAAKKRIEVGRIDVKTPSKAGESIVKTKSYKTWSRIIHGVINPKSKEYIPNISVYKKWYDSTVFINDVGEPTQKNMAFTRLDKEKGFYPDNCAWLTKSESSKINAEYMKKTGRLTGNKKK
jgi:group I intron endonuclease